MTITGDLILGEEIGEGDVRLEGVTVRGTNHCQWWWRKQCVLYGLFTSNGYCE